MNEHALVLASIIVGLGLTDQLVSLHRLIRARRKVRWDWLTLWIAALVFLAQVSVWWSLAGAKAGGDLSLGEFLPKLILLVLFFLMAATVLPDGNNPEDLDLREFYSREQRPIWLLFFLVLVVAGVGNLIESRLAGASWGQAIDRGAGDWLFILLSLTAVFVRKRWWHALVLAAFSLPIVSWMSRSLS